MQNHLVRGKTLPNPVLGPVLLNHALGDVPPLFVPLDYFAPGPANLSAAVEGFYIWALPADESGIYNLFSEFRRQHHNVEL